MVVLIYLEGNRGDDPKHRWAYVDDTDGGIHLFRFPEDTFSYPTGLSHELVHAYRFEHLNNVGMPPSPAFVFLEEGIAEYLSEVIEPKKATFSSYGYDQQSSFIQFIERELGRETIVRLAFAEDIYNEGSFTKYLNDSVSNWAGKWRKSILERFRSITNHTELGHQWRTKTPVAEYKVCRRGVEF